MDGSGGGARRHAEFVARDGAEVRVDTESFGNVALSGERAHEELMTAIRLLSVDLGGDGEVITYCTIGGRAATAWIVLAGCSARDHVRVYDGSWAE